MTSQPTTTGRPLRAPAEAALVAGLVVLVAGTFLPWLRSGTALRNSYATGGVIQRLLGADGIVGHVLSAWPFVSLVSAAAIALVLLGLYPFGAAAAVLAAVCAGTAAVGALSVNTGSIVRAAGLGPTVTLVGAVLTLVALLVHMPSVRAPLGRTIRRSR